MKGNRELMVKALLSLQHEAECEAFLDDLLTVRENEDLANRLYIAQLLDEGNTFMTIEDETGASSATISRVNRCLKYGKGYRHVLDHYAKKKDTPEE